MPPLHIIPSETPNDGLVAKVISTVLCPFTACLAIVAPLLRLPFAFPLSMSGFVNVASGCAG